MIQQLLDPRFLQDRTADLAQELRQRCNRFETATPEILSEAEKNGVSLNDLREALTQVSKLSSSGNFTRQPHEAAWLPRDPLLSIMQSALEEFYMQAGVVQKVPRRGLSTSIPPVTDASLKPDWIPTKTYPLMRQAEQSDFLGWGLSFAIAKSIRWLGGKAPFPGKDPSPYKIGSKARIILVGDWASGVPRAVKVAKQIENVLQDPAG